MSEIVAATLVSQLSAQGSELAHVEDSVKAVLRLATDQSINGRHSHA
jgi:hypothetical protein